MKRLLSSVFALLCVVSSVSCSTPTGTQSKLENNLGSPFSAKMTVNLDKLSAEGTIYRKGDRCWEAEFDSPNTLSGVKLSFEENIVKATVPLTGFGHLLAEGVRKAVDRDGFLGIFTGGLTASSAGITAALIAGLWASLMFKPKDKA